MKNKFFDFRLYREGLRQSRVIGITTIVLMTLAGVLTPVLTTLDYYLYWDPQEIIKPEYTNFYDMYLLLPAAMYVFVPLILLYLFRFLTKRNSSDFYHGIPHTRGCLLVSFFSAAMTWIVTAIGVSTVLSLAAVAFSPFINMNYSSILPYLVNTTVGCCLIGTIIVLAAGLTGTTFSNIMMAAMIAFLPRLILYLLVLMVRSMSWLFVEGEFLNWLSSSYNVASGFPLIVLESVFLADSPTLGVIINTLWPALYSAVLTIVYGALSYVVFLRRKSEAATHAAVNRKLQAANRIGFSLIFCLLPVLWIAEIICTADYSISDYLILIIVFYLLAVVAYFLYELVTTKKARNLAKIFPGLGILALLNVLMILGTAGVYRTEFYYCPDQEEIRSVSVTMDRYVLGSRYFMDRGANIQITDEDMIALMRESLADNIEYQETPKDRWEYDERVEVTFYTDGGKKVRNLYLTAKDYARYVELLERNEEYKGVYMDFPESKELEELTITGEWACNNRAQVEEVYGTFRKEIEEMGFEAWYEYINTYGGNKNVFFYLEFVYTEGSTIYTLSVPITNDMPKTLTQIISMANEGREEVREKILDALKAYGEDGKEDGKEDGSIWFALAFAEGEIVFNTAEDYLTLHDYLREAEGEAYLAVFHEEYDEKTDYYQIEVYFFAVDPKTFPQDLLLLY